MDIYKKILKLAIEGRLPKTISEDNFHDIDIFVELYERGFIKAINVSSLDGKAFLDPKITFQGREYFGSLKNASNNQSTIEKDELKKVFISYVRNNTNEVNLICKKFTEESISYWIDRESIEPGTLWKTAIRDAIKDGAYFLACFSREYAERTETYMNEEILVAIDILRIKPFSSGWFIPIKLSECEIPKIHIGAGYTLQDIQHLEFHDNWDTAMKRLIDVVKREETSLTSEINKDYFEKEYTYLGLKSLIESGNGTGFHNADLGHPVYRLGASDAPVEMLKDWEYADSPEKNLLYKMLSRLSRELKETGIEEMRFTWWYDFTEWRAFCKFATDVYDKKMGYK